jgi:hypothetical protein
VGLRFDVSYNDGPAVPTAVSIIIGGRIGAHTSDTDRECVNTREALPKFGWTGGKSTRKAHAQDKRQLIHDHAQPIEARLRS